MTRIIPNLPPQRERKKESPGYWRAYRLLDRLFSHPEPSEVAATRDELIALVANQATCSKAATERSLFALSGGLSLERYVELPVCWTYSAKRMSEEIETIHRIREPDRKKDEPDETYSQDHELLYGQLLDPNGLRGKQLFDWYRRIPGVTKKQAEEEVRGGWGFGPDRLC